MPKLGELSTKPGDKHGRLTVLEFSGRRLTGQVPKFKNFWKCQCDCGTEVEVNSHALMYGDTWHCGCAKKDRLIDLTGQRFGLLTIVSRNPENNQSWWCKCDCGNERFKSIHSLKFAPAHVVRSCGCWGAAKQREGRAKSHQALRDHTLNNYCAEPNSGCWLWLGGVTDSGYGHVAPKSWGTNTAHRVFYQHHIGPIPKGVLVRHKCDTRLCVNPEHLELGDHWDNAQDMKTRGRVVVSNRSVSPQQLVSILSSQDGPTKTAKDTGVPIYTVKQIMSGQIYNTESLPPEYKLALREAGLAA